MNLVYAALLSALAFSLSWIRADSFDRFMETFMYEWVQSDPELLSNLGLAGNNPFDAFNGKLTDISAIQNEKNLKRIRSSLARLHRFDRQRLAQEQQISFDVLSLYCKRILESASFGYGTLEAGNPFHPYPVNQLFGVQNNLPDFMVNIHQVTDLRSAKRYISRLLQWEKKFQQLIAELRLREKNGVLLPRFLIEQVLEETKGFIEPPPSSHMLYLAFEEKLEKAGLHQQEIKQQAIEAIESKVYPAYRQLIALLEGQLIRATQDAGVWKFPRGDAYYERCLQYHTTTSHTPQEVHELGLSEVARIQGEMREILKKMGRGDLSVMAGMQKLAHDPWMIYPDTKKGKEQILLDFQGIFDAIKEKLPLLFHRLPKGELKIEAVPEFRAATSALAYYEPGDLKGERPGVFFANTSNPKSLPKFIMPTLAYHEGVPGHHLQIALALEIPNLPIFRKIVQFTAYAEGWALYCEQLASEYGFTEGLENELGRLQFELMRAVRLVVDTGIHFKRWTREEAIRYMAQTTGQNESEVAIEIDRYIVLPGQACSYKIGMIKILELREKMRERLGGRFDIRDFHSLILESGALPLSVLEERLDSINGSR